MASASKLHNEYASLLRGKFYDAIPKAVLAAIAVSYAGHILESGFESIFEPGAAEAALLDEWRVLHENGIVPQKPVNLVPSSSVGRHERARES